MGKGSHSLGSTAKSNTDGRGDYPFYFHYQQSYWVRFMDYVHVVLGHSSWLVPSSSFGIGSQVHAAFPLTAVIGAAVSTLALQSGWGVQDPLPPRSRWCHHVCSVCQQAVCRALAGLASASCERSEANFASATALISRSSQALCFS